MAKNADIAFSSFRGDEMEAGIKELRAIARHEFTREIKVWASGGVVICAPTEKEARDRARYLLVERIDLDAAIDWDRQQGILGPSVPDDVAAKQTLEKRQWVAQHAPLVGTPEQIVSHLESVSKLGLDGYALTWMDYEEGVAQWNREVMPLMEQAGLRRPGGTSPPS